MSEALTYDPQPTRPGVYAPFDAVIEFAILERECLARIRDKIAREQIGEAFKGLDTDCRSS